MKTLIAITLLLVGVIHLIPVTGVVSTAKLSALYGLSNFTDVNLEILLRHRAVLFGLLGAFMVIAAFKTQWQAAVISAGLISTSSFLYLSWVVGDYSDQINRVVWIDWIALVALLIAAIAYLKITVTSNH